MKVLQLIYESMGCPFGFGGAGVRAYEIYKRLKGRHEITLLCMKYPGAADGEIEGLKHLFVGVESERLVGSVFSFTARAAGFVRRYGRDFDVIVENFLPSTPFFAKYLTSTPVILQIQDYWGRHTFKRYPLRFALPMFLVERCYPGLYRQQVFVSPVTKEKFHLSGEAVTIPNGVDNDLLRCDAREDDYVLFMSSIDFYKKGMDLLLEAFSRLSPLYPSLRLLIAGSGRDSEAVAHKADTLPVAVREKIGLPGWISGPEKVRLISGARFVVLPSRHESQPISLLEAAACGKPVVVSDIAELRFVEERGFGLSFSSGDSEELAKAMELLLKSDRLRSELGERGRAFAEEYSWDAAALRYEEMLKAFASGRSLRGMSSMR